jgi:Na+/H+-translocating membrane pyrophosphatase
MVAGGRSRRAALVGALLAGVILALATYSAQQAWLNHRHEHRHGDGAVQVAAGAARRV